MEEKLKKEILGANIALHAKEAALYDRIHPELTNRDERARLERLLALAIPPIPVTATPVALDVGAGTGFVSFALHRFGYHVDAVDISGAMLRELEKKLSRDVRGAHIHTMESDIDSFLAEHPRHQFSVITASSVLHHLPDYTATLRSLAAHLVPGGALVLFHEPSGARAGWMEHILRRVDWKLARWLLLSPSTRMALSIAHLSYDMADYHETHGFSFAQVEHALRDAGLHIVAHERYTVAQTWFMRRVFAWCFPPRSWSLVARKPREET